MNDENPVGVIKAHDNWVEMKSQSLYASSYQGESEDEHRRKGCFYKTEWNNLALIQISLDQWNRLVSHSKKSAKS